MVLTRLSREGKNKIYVTVEGHEVEIVIVDVDGGKVRVGIAARPQDVILRGEVRDRTRRKDVP